MPVSLLQTLMTRFHKNEEYWALPREVTPQQVRDAKAFDLAMRAHVVPSDMEGYLKPRLAAFLAHHFNNLTGAKANAIIAADWLKQLMPFPQDAVDQAIDHWVANESRKPLPSQIRNLAIDYFGRTAWENWERAQKVAAMTPTEPRTAKQEEEWRKPTPNEILQTLTMMHSKGFHNLTKMERCPLCQSQKVEA